MQFLGIGLSCRSSSDQQAEITVVLLDTRGTVLAVERRPDLDAVAALVRVLASGDTLIAAGTPLCERSRDARGHAAVQALRRRLALTDVESGVLECDAETFPFPVDEFDYASWPPEVCGHATRARSRTPRLAAACDDLVRRLDLLISAHPPMDLHSSTLTAALLTEPAPTSGAGLEQRLGLLNALLCAWAASSWHESPEQSPEQQVPPAGLSLAG
jgi:hypothetical protein